MKIVGEETLEQPQEQAQTATAATTTTMTTTTTTNAAAGVRMIAALEGLLSGIQSQNLTVHEKDFAIVQKCCFGCGNNNNTAVEEFAHGNDITKSQTYAALQGFLQTLQKDPTKRYHVVDQDCLTQTEDVVWLSIPKWQYDICRHHHHHHHQAAVSASAATQTTTSNNKNMKTAVAVAHLQCVVTTVRSLESSVFCECYGSNSSTTSGNWKVQEGTGPRGSAMVTLLDTSNSPPESTTTATETSSDSPFGGIQAVFSDQPRHVSYTGRLLSKLSSSIEETKKKKNGDVILRVFRCAPRSSLQQGIASVLHEQQQTNGDNVFDLWIRHVEVPENIPGIGEFVHPLDNSNDNNNNNNVSLLQLLTEVNVPESSLESDDPEGSPAALVPDDEEEEEVEKEEDRESPLGTSVATTTTAPRDIEPLNTIHDDGEDSASNQQPSSLQTPAAPAFVPNEFSNQALLSQQQQHPSLVTPLVTMTASSADNISSSDLCRNDDPNPTTMLVLDEEEGGELLSSPPRRSAASSGMAKEIVVDSPTTSGSEDTALVSEDVAENQAFNDDDEDALGGRGGGGGDVATTTTMASTNKDPSIASDEDDDNDSPPPVTSIETTTVTELKEAPKDTTTNKQQNNTDKKQKQGRAKKKVPTKDDKEAASATGAQQKLKSKDSSAAVSTTKSSSSPPPQQQQQHENTKTIAEKKNPAAAAVQEQQQHENHSQRHVGPTCKTCHLHKPRSEFSAAQLKKNKDRRCKDCIQSNRLVPL